MGCSSLTPACAAQHPGSPNSQGHWATLAVPPHALPAPAPAAPAAPPAQPPAQPGAAQPVVPWDEVVQAAPAGDGLVELVVAMQSSFLRQLQLVSRSAAKLETWVLPAPTCRGVLERRSWRKHETLEVAGLSSSPKNAVSGCVR